MRIGVAFSMVQKDFKAKCIMRRNAVDESGKKPGGGTGVFDDYDTLPAHNTLCKAGRRDRPKRKQPFNLGKDGTIIWILGSTTNTR